MTQTNPTPPDELFDSSDIPGQMLLFPKFPTSDPGMGVLPAIVIETAKELIEEEVRPHTQPDNA